MSLYRFARMTAVLAILKRYRRRLFRLIFALAFAFVSAQLYPDLARYLDAHHPEWAWLGLVAKSAIVYGALIYCFWLLLPLAGDPPPDDLTPPDDAFPKLDSLADSNSAAGGDAPETSFSKLDALAKKPRLRNRRQQLMDKSADPDKESKS